MVTGVRRLAAVLPYNALQLDPVKGQVSKCNMCVDRLEVGLKPACVSACVGNALDFGVIENTPENRTQSKTQIPGFPDPEITHPNIRFEQIKTLPDEMKRVDSAPVQYQKNETGNFSPAVDKKFGTEKQWNLGKLNSHENPLVFFTLLTQTSIGAFFVAFFCTELGAELNLASFASFTSILAYSGLVMSCLVLVSLALFLSTTHLGKPLRFYRGFNNLRYSPVCREGLGIALFMLFLACHWFFNLLTNEKFLAITEQYAGIAVTDFLSTSLLGLASNISAYLALASAYTGLYYMNRCYRIKARPFWDHWQVVTSFFGNSLSLGSILVAGFVLSSLFIAQESLLQELRVTTAILLFGLIIEAYGLFCHQKDMSLAEHEGAAAHYIQTTTFGKTYQLRNGILISSICLSALVLIFSTEPNSYWGLALFCIAAISAIFSSFISRALFYILVIPTTMPGAFFWRNKGFEQHARDIGLANIPQSGIVSNH